MNQPVITSPPTLRRVHRARTAADGTDKCSSTHVGFNLSLVHDVSTTSWRRRVHTTPYIPVLRRCSRLLMPSWIAADASIRIRISGATVEDVYLCATLGLVIMCKPAYAKVIYVMHRRKKAAGRRRVAKKRLHRSLGTSRAGNAESRMFG